MSNRVSSKERVVNTFREPADDVKGTIVESIKKRLAELSQNFRINRSLSAEEKAEFASLSERLQEWESQ